MDAELESLISNPRMLLLPLVQSRNTLVCVCVCVCVCFLTVLQNRMCFCHQGEFMVGEEGLSLLSSKTAEPSKHTRNLC